jgi:hypothetical protein
MRTPSFLSDRLREFLRAQKVATLPELKLALGTTADITVFRKLKELTRQKNSWVSSGSGSLPSEW